MQGTGLAVGLVCLSFAIFAAIITGIGWSVLHSSDVCVGSMHTYIRAISITATVELALLGFGMLLSLTSFCGNVMELIAVSYGGFVLILVAFAGSILNLAWFIWGIVLLANDECKGTNYYTMTIVLTVLSGIGIIGRLCSRTTNVTSSSGSAV